MSNIVRLVYVSEAAVPFSKPDLAALLRKSQQNNASRGLTGLLLFAGGHFMQVLEGHIDAVTARFELISEDPRHRRVHRLLCEGATDRLFGRWTMGSLNADVVSPLDRAQLRQLIEWTPDQAAVTDRTQVHKLLQNFSNQLAMAKAA
jgi:hypothetical protein